MLAHVIEWSLRHRVAVLVLTAAMAGAGVLAFQRLPLDAFPDTTPVQVQVNTVAPALSPLELERQVTTRVEQAISGLPGLVGVRSLLRFGLSQVTVLFEDGAEIWASRRRVLERPQGLALPAGLDPPTLGPVATGLGEVFQHLVSGEGLALAKLRAIQEWDIAPQLRSVTGVAEVNTWGGVERQIQVLVDPASSRSTASRSPGSPRCSSTATAARAAGPFTGQPMARIDIKRDALGRHGIRADEVLAVVAALGTPQVGELLEGERRLPITLRLGGYGFQAGGIE